MFSNKPNKSMYDSIEAIAQFCIGREETLNERLFIAGCPFIIENNEENNVIVVPNHKYLEPEDYFVTICEGVGKNIKNALLNLIENIPKCEGGKRFIELIRAFACDVRRGKFNLIKTKKETPREPTARSQAPKDYYLCTKKDYPVNFKGYNPSRIRSEMNKAGKGLRIKNLVFYHINDFREAIRKLEKIKIPKGYIMAIKAMDMIGCSVEHFRTVVRKRYEIKTLKGKFNTQTGQTSTVFKIEDIEKIAKIYGRNEKI